MSQTSLVETTGEPPRAAFDHPGILRLNRPNLSEGNSPLGLDLGLGQLFTLTGRFIYETTAGLSLPTYHISTRNTQSGKPWQLQLSHMLPSEARRVREAASDGSEEPFIRYDEDLTLYAGEKLNVPISLGRKPLLVIRGQKKGTVQGSVIMERSGRSYKFWHMVPIKHALTQAETQRMQALMHRRGYRDSDDWKKKLLLYVQERPAAGSGKLAWCDASGVAVADETGDKLNIADETDIEKRDLIISCWACKNFVLDTASLA
ncbi:hypothetical protein VFPPC_13814 [Pochonia chlamydosporia 170]|uniref:Uncharacterized protein n=1 Tax=Pochonia chlamydosporia 170 TaxID=1380566 RepID=A0A179FVT2_METCM|nr:hypothetical protein VFPPC_13814 [Pochonia chlamydosporia 170]OAQ69231.1 hypothetical protein VFPPC_13814 [Pochonia chlamydosporia 170]